MGEGRVSRSLMLRFVWPFPLKKKSEERRGLAAGKCKTRLLCHPVKWREPFSCGRMCESP